MLSRAGVRAGRPIAAVTASPAAMCVLSHAAAALGVPLFPLDPALPDAVVEDLLDQTGVDLVAGEHPVPGRRFVPDAALLDAASGPVPPSRMRPDGVALLVATSGSTGRPKAVMLTAAALAAAAAASAARTPFRPGDVWLACLPLFHIGGYSILARSAAAGADAVLHRGFDAERVGRTLAEDGISHLSLVPAMLAQLLDLCGAPPSTLRHVLVGGATLPADLAERAADRGWPVQPTYGMSETASQLATLPGLPRPWPPGLVGRPLPGAEALLAGDGRLKVRGPMLMAGYANPALAPGDGLEDGWFVTSDLAEIRRDGSLVILGRADDVIISGGKKILPALVEALLAPCPGLDAVCVVGRPDPVWGEVVTVVYRGGSPPLALLDWCRAHLPGWLRPRLAIPVAVLPTLATGKSDRSALRRLAEGHHAESGATGQDQGSTVR